LKTEHKGFTFNMVAVSNS